MLQLAELARTRFREAEGQRKDGDIDSADMTVNGAFVALHTRYYSHHLLFWSLIPLDSLSQYRSGADY